MTPKEKAKELIDSYYVLLDGFVTFEQVKQCALIAIDEVIKEIEYGIGPYRGSEAIKYWEDIKQEIEAL